MVADSNLPFLFGVIFYPTGIKDILKFATALTPGHSILDRRHLHAYYGECLPGRRPPSEQVPPASGEGESGIP
jgi:hypothetical protein